MNFYEILGVDRNADKKTIGKAYRKLAKQWHPDLNPDKRELAEKKMAEINEAYATLSNEVGRIDYNKKLDAEAARAKGGGRTSAGGAQAGRKPPPGSQQRRQRTPGADASNLDFNNIHNNFASFFGFDPATKEVTNEDKLNTFTKDRKKNPLDTTDFFEKFMGFKK